MGNRNQEIIDLFRDLVSLTTLDEGGPASFRVRAYENALNELTEFRDDLEPMKVSQLTKIDGVGKSTAQKIREYFDTGRIEKLEKLRAKYPPEFVELTSIPGLGPKSVLTLRDKLGIENIDQLRIAIENEEIRGLAGFGKKSEEKIAKALERAGSLGKNKRRTIATALPLAKTFVDRLLDMDVVERATYCGSLRRFRETIGDIDIVAISTSPSAVMRAFVEFPEVQEIVGQGETKSSIVTSSGFQADLRVVAPNEYGAAIMYFTGSKAHNIKLRQRAIARGWTLNEYGLTEADGGKVIAQKSEEEIYQALEMDFVPPPMREDHGETEAAAAKALPVISKLGSAIGDAWVRDHGDLSLKDVVKAAKARGLESLVIAKVAGSGAELSPPNKSMGIKLVHGVEISGEAAASLAEGEYGEAWVIANLEGHAGASPETITAILENPAVHAVVGLADRIIGEREPAELDIEAVLEKAAATQTTVIIDGRLERLDPPADWLRRARGLGVHFGLGSGAESADELANADHALHHAQRGWVDLEPE